MSLTRSATDPSFILSRYREKKRRRLEERRRLAGERQREMGSVRARAGGAPRRKGVGDAGRGLFGREAGARVALTTTAAAAALAVSQSPWDKRLLHWKGRGGGGGSSSNAVYGIHGQSLV